MLHVTPRKFLSTWLAVVAYVGDMLASSLLGSREVGRAATPVHESLMCDSHHMRMLNVHTSAR